MPLRYAAVCLALAAVSAASAAPANAAQTSFGVGPARACFEAAVSRDAGLAALDACDAAIGGTELTARDRAATLVNRGVLYLIRREPASALADFDLALKLRPDLGEALVNRGAALVLLGRFEDAVAAIDAGLALKPLDPHEAYFNRALAQERRGDLAGAYADFQTALALKPDWDLARTELARFHVKPR